MACLFIRGLNEAITHVVATQHSGISQAINPLREVLYLFTVLHVLYILYSNQPLYITGNVWKVLKVNVCFIYAFSVLHFNPYSLMHCFFLLPNNLFFYSLQGILCKYPLRMSLLGLVVQIS